MSALNILCYRLLASFLIQLLLASQILCVKKFFSGEQLLFWQDRSLPAQLPVRTSRIWHHAPADVKDDEDYKDNQRYMLHRIATRFANNCSHISHVGSPKLLHVLVHFVQQITFSNSALFLDVLSM